MSTADTHLNAGVVNIVCDVIDPDEKMSVEKTVTLSSFGLAGAGGTVFPAFIIGNMKREKNEKGFRSDVFGNCRWRYSSGIVIYNSSDFSW